MQRKKQELRYRKGDYEIFYGVMYYPETAGYIHLSYYEHENRQFSKESIDLYYQLYKSFASNDLIHLPETAEDIKAALPVVTPEEFNRQHPLPPISEETR